MEKERAVSLDEQLKLAEIENERQRTEMMKADVRRQEAEVRKLDAEARLINAQAAVLEKQLKEYPHSVPPTMGAGGGVVNGTQVEQIKVGRSPDLDSATLLDAG